MTGVADSEEHARPFKTTALGPAWASRLVPWVVIVPILFVLAGMLSSPGSNVRLVGAVLLLATIVVLVLPVATAFAPENRVWLQRTILASPDLLEVGMPGHDPLRIRAEEIGSAVTGTLILGMPLPPTFQLLTEFRNVDGHRLPQLTVHHYGYRYGVRLSDFNPDGPALLRVLLRGPAADRVDLSSRTLVTLLAGDPEDGVSTAATDALRAGRLHRARRMLARDARRAKHVSHTLVMLDHVLARRGLSTATKAHEQDESDPLVRYYLAQALLASIPASPDRRARVVAKRLETRAEAIGLLEGLRRDDVWGGRASADLEALRGRPRAAGRGNGRLRSVLQYRAHNEAAARRKRRGGKRRH